MKKIAITFYKILEACLLTFLVFFIIISFTIMIQFMRHPDSIPGVYHYKFLTVLTGSMRPTFNPGDVVIINDGIDTNQLQKGDIITFKQSDYNTITHRIYEVVKEGNNVSYITKGDANLVPDDFTVNPSQVIGVRTLTIPYIGYLSNFMSSTYGMIIVLGLALMPFIFKSKKS